MTSPLPWKQLALILFLGGGVIYPSLRFLLHRIRKLCQDLSFCNIWKYVHVHAWVHYRRSGNFRVKNISCVKFSLR